MYLPNILEDSGRGIKSFDLPSKLLQERIVYLGNEVNELTSTNVVMQLMWLNSSDPEKSIDFYINSPGGIITEGMAIYDTMNLISAKVNTICIGQASSMGSFLLSSGTGVRAATKNSRIMIHQPLGGAQGQASDIAIQAKEILRMKDMLLEIMVENSKGKCSEDSMLKLFDRDSFMSPEEALALGVIDKVL